MSRESFSEKKLTLPEVRKMLDAMGEANLDQLQRRTFDYVSKFSRSEAEDARGLVSKLMSDFGVEEDDAVQIVNCMPKSIDELRVFLASGRKIVEASTLKTMLELLNQHRKTA